MCQKVEKHKKSWDASTLNHYKHPICLHKSKVQVLFFGGGGGGANLKCSRVLKILLGKWSQVQVHL